MVNSTNLLYASFNFVSVKIISVGNYITLDITVQYNNDYQSWYLGNAYYKWVQ